MICVLLKNKKSSCEKTCWPSSGNLSKFVINILSKNRQQELTVSTNSDYSKSEKESFVETGHQEGIFYTTLQVEINNFQRYSRNGDSRWNLGKRTLQTSGKLWGPYSLALAPCLTQLWQLCQPISSPYQPWSLLSRDREVMRFVKLHMSLIKH